MTVMPESLFSIEIDSLSKVYKPRKGPVVEAVKPLSLAIPKGQVFGFLGANGAGKTTTIKMICGLIIPTSGRVRVNGYDVARSRSRAMRQVGAVLEGTRNTYWRLTAWQNLMYFGRLKGCYQKEMNARAERLLRELDLWERRNDPLRTFSRGMQQKVAIACALIADPPIMLLDEPTLGLDVQAAVTVKEWIARLAHDEGKTIVLTTHQLDMAQSLCDTVAIMRKGRLLTHQPLQDLLHLFQQEYYQFWLEAADDTLVRTHFPDLKVSYENGQMLLSGLLAGREQLYDYLQRFHSLNLPLLSAERIEPNLEDVFLRFHTTPEEEEQYASRSLSNV